MVTTRSSRTKVNEEKPKETKKTKEEASSVEETESMEVEQTEEQKLEEKRALRIKDINVQLKELEKAGMQREPRIVSKVLRQLPKTRRFVDEEVLLAVISQFHFERRDAVLGLLGLTAKKVDTKAPCSEVEVYLTLISAIYLLDKERLEQSREILDNLFVRAGNNLGQRRSMDPLNAKIYFYHSRVYELLKVLDQARTVYMKRLRTVTLHAEYESESVLLNLLLRNYLHYDLYEQAEKLISKSTFPEQANNNEYARYFYYLGRIKAIQLEYSNAQKMLTNALRKSPQVSGAGFRQAATKLLTVVDLLLGDIPERSRFTEKVMEVALKPYFSLTQAVRIGNLSQFNKVLEEFGEKFKADRTLTLILRLRHNVIKTGVRRISLAYSRISLADIADHLALDGPEDAEFIVAKAVRDGVIDAQLDHKAGNVASYNARDTYASRDPERAFDKRIKFCHNLYAQSVKAMRFPPKSYHDPLSPEERRQREQEDLEFAQEMAEDDDMY